MFRPTLISSFCSMIVTLFTLSIILALPACQTPGGEPATATDSLSKRPALATFKRNPQFRPHVKKDPVAEYRVRTDNPLNELYFTVRLYETPQTMKYLAKVEFEGLTGEDTIKFPDLGIPPHPVLKKGPEKYACIIGLLDNNKDFRELKKVYVTDKGRELKITTLKHYLVTEDYRLVGQ